MHVTHEFRTSAQSFGASRPGERGLPWKVLTTSAFLSVAWLYISLAFSDEINKNPLIYFVVSPLFSDEHSARFADQTNE